MSKDLNENIEENNGKNIEANVELLNDLKAKL